MYDILLNSILKARFVSFLKTDFRCRYAMVCGYLKKCPNICAKQSFHV